MVCLVRFTYGKACKWISFVLQAFKSLDSTQDLLIALFNTEYYIPLILILQLDRFYD